MLAVKHLGSNRLIAHAGFLLLICLALLFGLASAILPGWFVFAILLVPAVAVLVFVRPEYGLTACVALVCGLVHPALVPRIPVFGGALAAADAALSMLALYAVWGFATQERKTVLASVAGARWLAWSLGLFGISLALAVPMSLWYWGLAPSQVLGEARDLFYLALLPIAVVILRRQERQHRFVISFVGLGGLFSVGQILQGVLGIPVFGDAGISALETLGRLESSTTRANTLGLSVIILSLLLTVGAYVLGVIRKPLFFGLGGLLLVGIVLTFGRTTFAAVLICVSLLVWWLNPKKFPSLLGALMISLAIGSVLAITWKPESFAAVVYRMTSVGEELDHGYSAKGRYWEAEAMVPQIMSHPLTGLGLGADYIKRPGISTSSGLDRYVHNAYLYMAGKMGIPALAFFLASIGAIFFMGRRSARSDRPAGARVVGAAGASMMVYYLGASLTEPHFMSDYSVVVIASVGAMVYLSARRSAAVAIPAVAGQAKPHASPKLLS